VFYRITNIETGAIVAIAEAENNTFVWRLQTLYGLPISEYHTIETTAKAYDRLRKGPCPRLHESYSYRHDQDGYSGSCSGFGYSQATWCTQAEAHTGAAASQVVVEGSLSSRGHPQEYWTQVYRMRFPSRKRIWY